MVPVAACSASPLILVSVVLTFSRVWSARLSQPVAVSTFF